MLAKKWSCAQKQVELTPLLHDASLWKYKSLWENCYHFTVNCKNVNRFLIDFRAGVKIPKLQIPKKRSSKFAWAGSFSGLNGIVISKRYFAILFGFVPAHQKISWMYWLYYNRFHLFDRITCKSVQNLARLKFWISQSDWSLKLKIFGFIANFALSTHALTANLLCDIAWLTLATTPDWLRISNILISRW